MILLERVGRRPGWRWLVGASGVALFALRVCLESTPPRPLWGLAIALSSIVASYAIRVTAISFAPLWLAWLYVVWPAASPAAALGVGFITSAALLIQGIDERRCPAAIVDSAVFLAALSLYVTTLAPTVLPADSGEFQIVGPLLGVAHPPGFALFTMLGKVFSLLPFGEVTWRANLMGAVTGALTLVVVGRTARRLTGSSWAAIAAAGALGVSTTFWAQSTTINIRALTMFFTALCCDCLVRFVRAPVDSRQAVRALTGLAVSFGLLIAHHAWPIFFAPVFGFIILWHDPGLAKRYRVWPRYITAFLIPFLTDLYIVARAVTGAPFGTDAFVDAGRVLDHLLGRGFRGDMFAFLRLDRVLWERFLVVGNILHFQFGTPLLIVSAAGFVWLWWKRRKPATLLGGVFVVMAFIVATYRAPQSVEYLMPAYIPVALCIGCAVSWPIQRAATKLLNSPATRLAHSSLAAVLLLPIFTLGCAHLPSYLELHRDRSAREYAEVVLSTAPPDAHILSNWHWYTPLRYVQLVEEQRPDVLVTYIYPQGATAMPQAWLQRIARELEHSDRPLIVTNYYPTYADSPYRFVPHGEAFHVQAEPTKAVPVGLTRTDVDFAGATDRIRLLGYRTGHPGTVRPGDWVTVDLTWQPLVRLERGYSVFVQLIGADGVPLGQDDRRYDAAPTYEPGTVLTDRYRFPVFLTAAPGTYRLVAGVYWTREDGSWQRLTLADGSDTITLSEVSVLPATIPPVTMHAQYRPFVAGPTLVGIDYDDTLPEQRRVYLHWRAGGQPALAQLRIGQQLVAQGQVSAAEGGGYVTTVLDAPPDARDLSLALRQADTGAPLRRRGAWGIAHLAPVPLPRPGQRQHYLPFGGKLALIGVRTVDVWRAGEQQRVALRFLGLRPIVSDNVISVSVHDNLAIDGPSDSVPAIGAIPTFKWVRGSQIVDAHLIPVRADASGQALLMLGVYDAFTAHALPPLDERIARLGLAGVPLRQVSIP